MRLAPLLLLISFSVGCRDISRFSSGGDGFEGPVVAGSFVRTGVDQGTRMCLTLDTDHLQDSPGTISTSDGRFHMTPLRPIPQIWHDPLSTLEFGEGRVQNLVYAATPGDAGAEEQLVIVSLMKSGGIQIRMLRGAAVFAIFELERRAGQPCVP